MRFPEKRRLIMKRSMALGHCVCNPRKPCPCDTLIQHDLCPCAGERPDPPKGTVKLTRFVRKAGCASKISRADLKRVLKDLPIYEDPDVLIGIPAGDDAGVYRIEGGHNLVQTVDVFSPVVDDPFLFGQISAANSVSDIYAMGGRPICALSIIGFPIEELPHEIMREILRGGIEKMREASVSVIGGHSINDEEIKCGFAVTGLVKGTGSITNSDAREGDWIVLTKPIGTGLISFAAQIGLASDEATALIGQSMAELNRDAAELMIRFHADACTDVTGFSLIGHLSEMAFSSGLTAQVQLALVPAFAESLGCLRSEIIPGATERNKESFSEWVQVLGTGEPVLVDLLYDAQTSGGLLVALPPDRAPRYIEEMQTRGHCFTSKIGEFLKSEDCRVRVVLGEPTNLAGICQLRERPQPVAEQSCCAEEFSCCAEPEVRPVERRVENVEVPMSGQEKKTSESFKEFMKSVNAPGSVDARTKRLLAIALSISERCGP
ncbi:MAG TPA: selenide, water dikinase SelD, partial [bacterium]|nr:selenide, water dikinase SelD [bacterium]